MAEVTDRAARAVGFDSFADMELEPTSITTNPDGTVTVTFPDPVDDLTLTLVRERMTTRDEAEMQMQRMLTTVLADLDTATEPTVAQLKDAVMLLGVLVLSRGSA